MYPKKPNNWLKHVDFMLIDMICLELALVIAYFVRYGVYNPYTVELYRTMAFVYLLIDCSVAVFFESFKNVLKRGYYKEFLVTVKHDTYVMLLAVFFLYAIKQGTNYSRSILIISIGVFFVLSYLTRNGWKYLIRRMNSSDKNKRAMVIITTESMLSEVIEGIELDYYPNQNIVGIGVIDGDYSHKIVNQIHVYGNEDMILRHICRAWVDEVFIQLPEGVSISERLSDSFDEMAVTVHIKIANKVDSNHNQYVERMGPYTVLTTSVKMVSMRQIFIKRFIDICGGIVGCFISGILYLFVAPCIKILSPGPVIFSQIRIGKNGKRFKIYKFRSMCIDAEEKKKDLMSENLMESQQISKFHNDCRIIGSEKGEGKGFGNFIRKYSIDEFPQFFNVLKGDMSLVGTRPPTEDEWLTYDLHHRARLAVKPGITGMWQVNGRSNITDFEEIVDLDKQYIEDWSIGLDVKILFRTVKVVLAKEGSM